MDQSNHMFKLYIYSFVYDNFFILQSIFLKIWETYKCFQNFHSNFPNYQKDTL